MSFSHFWRVGKTGRFLPENGVAKTKAWICYKRFSGHNRAEWQTRKIFDPFVLFTIRNDIAGAIDDKLLCPFDTPLPGVDLPYNGFSALGYFSQNGFFVLVPNYEEWDRRQPSPFAALVVRPGSRRHICLPRSCPQDGVDLLLGCFITGNYRHIYTLLPIQRKSPTNSAQKWHYHPYQFSAENLADRQGFPLFGNVGC
jgi:hypothetical protein